MKETYDNLPLPLPVVAAMAADLLLARPRPMPLPGPPALHRTTGTALVVAGVGLNAWALAERRPIAGSLRARAAEGAGYHRPVCVHPPFPIAAAVIQAQDNRRRDAVCRFSRNQRREGMARAGGQCQME